MSPHSPSWTLHQLEVAYRQGYLEALLGRAPRCPPHEILAASWEAGWRDGGERLRQQQVEQARPCAEPGQAPRLSVQIRHSVSGKDRV
ncbi:hypothetical protein N5C93_13100 [Pseudomonas nitroreducens]|uniref:ribosome modulation factor n=1 Tax=Pseudomonas nitroreducens TaxID=46680 RepID=UPI0014747644|nr:hypothetical protein [Pseudomonas nitroreducens]MDH1073770.1 hypothetical protein [Pseudomonas nitroreducens]NMZ71577.1 hypothetical protein [Pseudomonas nitroreducens]